MLSLLNSKLGSSGFRTKQVILGLSVSHVFVMEASCADKGFSKGHPPCVSRGDDVIWLDMVDSVTLSVLSPELQTALSL